MSICRERRGEEGRGGLVLEGKVMCEAVARGEQGGLTIGAVDCGSVSCECARAHGRSARRSVRMMWSGEYMFVELCTSLEEGGGKAWTFFYAAAAAAEAR